MRYIHWANTLTFAAIVIGVFLESSTACAQKGGGRGKGNGGGKVSRGGGGYKAQGGSYGGNFKSHTGGSNKHHHSGGQATGGIVNQRGAVSGGFSGKNYGGNKHYGGGHYGSGTGDFRDAGKKYGGAGAHYGGVGKNYGGARYYGGGKHGNQKGRHHGGHRNGFSQIFIGPGGIDYSFFGRGFGISVALPRLGYYDYFAPGGYVTDSFYPPYYDPFAVPVESVPIVEPLDPPIPPTTIGSVNNLETQPVVIDTTGIAADYQRQAELAFREHRYAEAARLVHHALIEDGKNGKLHLFASQALFAIGDYQASAAAIQSGASLLDRSEWGYVVENYDKFYRGNDYISQMDKLIEFVKKNPTASYSLFLTGYHYKFLGYDDVADEYLTRAVGLESRDRLAAELLNMTDAELLPEPTAAKPEAESGPADAGDGLLELQPSGK